MEFVTTNLRERLLSELAAASQAEIAVAYFCPEGATLSALQSVPRLRLLVSNNFQINNPNSLETLHHCGKWVRAISPEDQGGNLHAKVYVVTRRDGSEWAMVGSANLTRAGLVSNQEACVLFDSKNQTDMVQLKAIREWLNNLLGQDHLPIDFELAKSVYKTQNYQHIDLKPESLGNGYWALKPGRSGEFWQNWLSENVVSIGWRQLPDTFQMNRFEAERAYRTSRPEDSDGQAKINVPQILNFTQNIQPGQLVLICGRYDSIGTADRNVYIYGVARMVEVGGHCYYFDAKSSWHRCKRHARIQRIEQSLPRSYLTQTIHRGSFVPTIMQLDKNAFSELVQVFRTELGVMLWV